MKLIVALDLEGTLISNAVSVFPRHNLRSFADSVLELADEVVLYTSVNSDYAISYLRLLTEEGHLPPGFADRIPCIAWSGPTKDLANVPGFGSDTVLLVDDQPGVIHPGQEAFWLRIDEFMPPFDQEDAELERIAGIIQDWRQRIDSEGNGINPVAAQTDGSGCA